MPDAAAVEFLPQMPSAEVPYQFCISLICAVVNPLPALLELRVLPPPL